MILRPHQIYLLRMTGRATLANGGGGGGSSSSSQATNTTTSLVNKVSSTDSRSVASEHAIALGGANDSVTQNSTTNNTDSSVKVDGSNRSTNFSSMSNSGNTYKDSGNSSFSSSSTTNVTTTDFGSVQASIDAMKTTARAAVGLSGDVAGSAIGALTHQSDNTMGLIDNLFQFAKTSSANSQGTAMQALGLADNATAMATMSDSNTAAMADKDKKHMEYMVAAGGALLAILILKK